MCLELVSTESESAELLIVGSMYSMLLEDSIGESVALELLSSPHAEIKIADISAIQELRNGLLEIAFI